MGERESSDPPDNWTAADRVGTTPPEETEGEPLSLRLADEHPEDLPPEPDKEAQDTPLGEWLRVMDGG